MHHGWRLGAAAALALAFAASPAHAVDPDIEMIGKVRIINGGTGAVNAADARTNLGLPSTGTLVTLTGIETLTNKTLTAPTLTTPALGVATGTSLALLGAGQTTSTAFSTAGNLGGSLYARDSGSGAGNGGAVVFGASQGAFAVIKGVLTDGTSNTVGDIYIASRTSAADATLTNRLYITGATGTVSMSGAVTSAASFGAHVGTAIPAGGTAGAGVVMSSTANFGVFFGSGAPTLSAAKGSLYLRSDGSGVGDRIYVNTDGSTGWAAITTVS